jgi:5-hydroxyisourate hydrolase
MGRLTTHVLNTADGVPAAGMAVRLIDGEGRVLVETRTNADGRCEGPLLQDAGFKPGRYRLAFEAGAYFRDRGVKLPEPAFLDVVEIAFGIADATAHYHVPLLVSPWAYSTYRGS